MKKMSQRQERMAEVVRQVVAQALVDGSVPVRVDGANIARLTLSDVWISADLRIAKCFVSGAGVAAEAVILQLNASANAFRKILSRRLENKYIPSVRFMADTHGEQALDVFADLRQQEAQS